MVALFFLLTPVSDDEIGSRMMTKDLATAMHPLNFILHVESITFARLLGCPPTVQLMVLIIPMTFFIIATFPPPTIHEAAVEKLQDKEHT
jgi:hypothetical protein